MSARLTRDEADAYLPDITRLAAAGKSTAAIATILRLTEGQTATIMRRHGVVRAGHQPRQAGVRPTGTDKPIDQIRADLSARAVEDWVMLDAVDRGQVRKSASGCVFYSRSGPTQGHRIDKRRVDRQIHRLTAEGLVHDAAPGDVYRLTDTGEQKHRADPRAARPDGRTGDPS